MVDDKPDGDAESAGGGVVDVPEWFEVEGDGGVAQVGDDAPATRTTTG